MVAAGRAPRPWRSPAAIRSSVRVAESVASTARPSAPPTWAVVLTRPEARPASSLRRAGHRQRHQRREADADAEAEQDHRRQHVRAVAAVDRRPREERQADRDQHQPGISSVFGAEAHDQRLGVPERQRAHDERRGQEGEADLERVVAEHPLQVERRRGRTSRTSRRRAAPGSTLAPETLRERKIRSGISGVCGGRLADDEGDEQDERAGAERERRARAPAVSAAGLTIV